MTSDLKPLTRLPVRGSKKPVLKSNKNNEKIIIRNAFLKQ